jgi:hypothetical protein
VTGRAARRVRRYELEETAEQVAGRVADRLAEARSRDLQIVKAPPGAGKTELLVALADATARAGRRVAVATFTNSQADQVAERVTARMRAAGYRQYPVVRFTTAERHRAMGAAAVEVVSSKQHLPGPRSVSVATAAKWGLIDVNAAAGGPFDVLLVDEAWQITWADFLLLGQVSGSFVLIGDPGQIPPVVAVPTQRWETAAAPPHLAAPEVLLGAGAPAVGGAAGVGGAAASVAELPGTRRLPAETVELARAFYDFHFEAFAAPGERGLAAAPETRRGPDRRFDEAIDAVAATGAVAVTVPTPDDGPPAEADATLADAIAAFVTRLLRRGAQVRDDGAGARPLRAADVGIASTRRAMNTRIHLALPEPLRREIRVDTPERWQGLECALMVVVHPLSGTLEPAPFDLETGRLCVMASRHRAGLVVATRDHVGDTLDGLIVPAAQPLGRPDVAGLGHARHRAFWDRLVAEHGVVGL